jgi:hypothetical protein
MGHKQSGISKGLSLGVVALLALMVLWATQPLAENRDNELQNIILRQIEAFANGDQDEAWAHASEGIKRRFGSPQAFLDMVRQAYPAVHGATAIQFEERVPHKDFEVQVVKLRGPDGKRWVAYYSMVLVEGVWKIMGVRLQEAEIGV